jgi:hypothetical protein
MADWGPDLKETTADYVRAVLVLAGALAALIALLLIYDALF